jgi:hypothetical protein
VRSRVEVGSRVVVLVVRVEELGFVCWGLCWRRLDEMEEKEKTAGRTAENRVALCPRVAIKLLGVHSFCDPLISFTCRIQCIHKRPFLFSLVCSHP